MTDAAKSSSPSPSPSPSPSLGAGREFDLIRAFLERWGDTAVGIGDDAALLEVPRGDQLVVSTDTAIDGVHFRRGWLPTERIADRAVTAALSDLAAMAATPLGVVVALELPPAAQTDPMAIADGIATAARRAGTVIRGGNVAGSDRLVITTTVFGSAHAPARRSGARPGDFVYLTGTLGGPAAAVRALRQGSAPAPALLERFARPVARLREARWLAARGMTAAIDISDGLAADALHLATASGVSLDIRVDEVPAVAGAAPPDLFGGEEYELLLASRVPLQAAEFSAAFGVPLTLVGRAREGPPEARFTRAGARVAPPPGYDHLSR